MSQYLTISGSLSADQTNLAEGTTIAFTTKRMKHLRTKRDITVEPKGNELLNFDFEARFGEFSCLFYPSSPLPAAIRGFTVETSFLLGSLAWIQDVALGNCSDCDANLVASIATSCDRLDAVLSRFAGAFSAAHRPKIPMFHGRAVSSYHETALEISSERRSWLWKLLSWKDLQ